MVVRALAVLHVNAANVATTTIAVANNAATIITIVALSAAN
jgi:hypothetical protein